MKDYTNNDAGCTEVPGEGDASGRETPMPPNCDPSKSLGWRLDRAYHLATHAIERPIHDRDPVVELTANFFADCHDGKDDMELTVVHLGIREATEIAADASLERDILAARLLAQQSPAEIAAKSRFSLHTVEAYGLLLFDVAGPERTRMWFSGLPHDMPTIPLMNMTLGGALKTLAVRNGSEALGHAVEVVSGLTGPFLADGLPDTESLDGQKELRIRLDLAKLMLPPLREGQCLFDRMRDVPPDDEQPSEMTEEEIEEALSILSCVKLPESVLREIEELHQDADPTLEVAPVA
jgi:hypothetical protein